MHLVLGGAPHRATAVGGIRLLGSRGGNILPHPPALVVGPAGDTELFHNTDPREELDLSNDGLYQNPAGPFSDFCRTSS